MRPPDRILETCAWAAAVHVAFTVRQQERDFIVVHAWRLSHYIWALQRLMHSNNNGNRCVGRGEPAAWPPRSPDLKTRNLDVLTHFTTASFFISSAPRRKPSTMHCELAVTLTFRYRASCILGQAFRYSPEYAFYIFNQQMYFIIWYLLDRASLI